MTSVVSVLTFDRTCKLGFRGGFLFGCLIFTLSIQTDILQYMVINMLRLAIASYVLISRATFGYSEIISKKSDRSSPYTYEYYYDDATSSSCDAVVMINVGTFMSIGSYSKLAQSMVLAASQQNSTTTGTVAIIVDSNPGRITKDDGMQYANVVNAITSNIANIIPICNVQPLFFVGGHSGGGKGAINAIQMKILTFPVAGFVGLDPFQISKADFSELRIDVPSLHWGFSRTSCLVVKEEAAEAAYNISNPNHRIFYRVNTNHYPVLFLSGPHCSFANHGCFGSCKSARALPWIRTQVGVTFHRFVLAVQMNNFERNQFVIDKAEAILIANEEIFPKVVGNVRRAQTLLKPALA